MGTIVLDYCTLKLFEVWKNDEILPFAGRTFIGIVAAVVDCVVDFAQWNTIFVDTSIVSGIA